MQTLPIELKEMALKVPENKKNEVQKVLNDIFDGTEKWEKQVNDIKVKSVTDILPMQMADTARLNVKKARLSAEKIFDEKREFLKVQMSDFKLEDSLWLKSKQIMQLKFKHIEETAKYKADFAKRFEAEQKELLIEKRLNQIFPYNHEITRQEVENMTDEMFEILLNGLIDAENKRIEEEKQAEAERKELERKESERVAKIEAENKMLEIERKKAEYEAKKLTEIEALKQAELRGKIESERKEKEKIKRELKAKAEIEAKKLAEIEAKKQAELKKDDGQKVLDLILDLQKLKTKYTFESEKYQNIYRSVNLLIYKVINFIQK